MKREGHVYERCWQWEHLVRSEATATKRKRNYGVERHAAERIRNLVEIQQNFIRHEVRTGEYSHDQRVSGQGKMRDIAKLKFHPSHIQHQSLCLAADERVERALITHTYASRIGYGQAKAAKQLWRWMKSDPLHTRWYAQADIVRYYENIPHDLLRRNLYRLFKDRDFVETFMEPFGRFSDTGRGVPLGIRPSQTAGNIALMRFDRFVKETLRVRFYLRYLDDFVVLGETKGYVKRMMKRMAKELEGSGFVLHPPKIRPATSGLDMLGFVTYPAEGQFWRRVNKAHWLKRRSKVTNRRRLIELDAAAKGMLVHGNKHCKRLYKMATGVNISALNIPRRERTDKDGVRIIDAPKTPMSVVLGKEVTVTDWVRGVRTSQGEGRMAVLVELFGQPMKLIVNAAPVKDFFMDMEEAGVTRFVTVFIDKGGLRYDIDRRRTVVLEINGREVEEVDGVAVYKDNGEKLNLTR